MSLRNEAIFRRWIKEVWNEGNEATIDELFDRNAVATFPAGLENKPLYGIDEYKHFVRLVHRSFVNLSVTIDQIASDENKVVSYCTVTAEKRATDDQAISGRKMTASGLCQMIIENGMIVQTWSNIDIGYIAESTDVDLI